MAARLWGYRLLTGIIYGWMGVALLVNGVAVASQFLLYPFWAALETVQDWYSPFNVWNLLAEGLLCAPALAAYWLRQRWYPNHNMDITITKKEKRARPSFSFPISFEAALYCVSTYGSILESQSISYCHSIVCLTVSKESIKNLLPYCISL